MASRHILGWYVNHVDCIVILCAKNCKLCSGTDCKQLCVGVYDVIIVAMIGLGGFQANIIQFGADQLHDDIISELHHHRIHYTSNLARSELITLFRLCSLTGVRILVANKNHGPTVVTDSWYHREVSR